MYRQAFYNGLYFAKLIRLADGETLFDFLKTCSKTIDPLTSAEINPMAKPNLGFYLQYFPVLREVGNGEENELQILIDRQGDKFVARSPLFSSSVLQSSTFMRDHGVECAR